MTELSRLVEQKKYWGSLSGQDAVAFLRQFGASGDGRGRWTPRDFEEFTRWQLGLPTSVQFQILAGPVDAHAPKRVEVPTMRPLHARKYGTIAERQAARKAKEAARQARLRLKKTAW